MELKLKLANSLADKAELYQTLFTVNITTQRFIALTKIRVSNRKFINRQAINLTLVETIGRKEIEENFIQGTRCTVREALLNNPNVTKPKGRLPN